MSLFRRTTFSDFDFNVGSGTEYILVGGDYLVFSASGVIQRVMLAAPEKGSQAAWRIESLIEGEINVLYEGSFTEVEERFRLIKDRARRVSGRPQTSFKSLLLVSLLTAVAVCALVGLSQRNEMRAPVLAHDQANFSDLMGAMKLPGGDYRHLLPSLLERSEMSPESLRQSGKEQIAQVIPDLKPADSGKPVGEEGRSTPGLPEYSPELYKDAQTLPVEAQEEQTMAVAKDTSSQVKPGELAAIQEELKKLSPEQASEVLRRISMLTPEQMKGDALASLPVNVRAILEKAGEDASLTRKTTPGIATTDEQGVPTKLIILPPKVIDSFRTHDGISSIPENASWQARGNPTVHIPLPGGGDIQSVSDLEKFGLKP